MEDSFYLEYFNNIDLYLDFFIEEANASYNKLINNNNLQKQVIIYNPINLDLYKCFLIYELIFKIELFINILFLKNT